MNQSGRSGEQEDLFAYAGTRSPDGPARSVVAIPTALSRLPDSQIAVC
jgi:hypothetical protein